MKADWFHSLLRLALQGVAASEAGSGCAADFTKPVFALLQDDEPPFQLGDGMDVWDYLRGAVPTSPRLEMVHEAHPQTSAGKGDGNGEALRVGDMKIVIRSGGQWNAHDGWYGGPGGTDFNTTGSYCYNASNHDAVPPDSVSRVGRATFPPTVVCPPPPASFTKGFACEADKTSPCLFNVSADPCEHVDLSQDAQYKAVLSTLMARLQEYRDTAVISTAAHPNPDGRSCPYIARALAADGAPMQAWMPCNNDGSLPLPPWGPTPTPTPAPGSGAALKHLATAQCLGAELTMVACDGAASRVWHTGKSGALEVSTTQLLKVLEQKSTSGSCATWTTLHLGPKRDSDAANSFTLASIDGEATTVKSGECSGQCLGLNGTTAALAECDGGAGTDGWSLVKSNNM